jgi:hypothetical protein
MELGWIPAYTGMTKWGGVDGDLPAGRQVAALRSQ